MTGLMEYLPPVQQQPQQGGALKYTGAIAQNYDAERQSKAKWTVEQAVIESMLADLAPGSWVLDAPCGSGRFLKYCLDHHLVYRGLDISEDMIRQAAAKTEGRTPVLKFDTHDGRTEDVPQIAFTKASVLSSGIPDKSVDAVLNIRISRWLTPEENQQMFREMQRISRDRIILTARVCNHSHARPLALYEAMMTPEWRLERSECGASGPADAPVEDPAYRIFLFKRKSAEVSQPKSDDAWVMDPYEAA
jgi:ubiquinone/menaquinone biosynthesis C-methylase UbiE